LEACPSFDREQAEAQLDPEFDWSQGWTPSPMIVIEMPEDLADPTITSTADLVGGESEDVRHFAELAEVLGQASTDFMNSTSPSPTSTPTPGS
jgi:hypothetical protein